MARPRLAFTARQFAEMKRLINLGLPQKQICQRFSVNQNYVSRLSSELKKQAAMLQRRV